VEGINVLSVLSRAAVVAAALALLAAPATADSDLPPVYLSLGDSLAAGSQPDANGNDRPTNQGYADFIGQRLQKVYPGLRTVKLSCGGTRTRTILEGGDDCQAEDEPGQVVQAERYMAKHLEVVLVTVDVGDNDVEGCLDVHPPAIDVGCIHRGRATIGRNLPVIAKRLKAAAGPHTAVVGITDYDQFLALWLDGAEGRAAARRAVRIIHSLNTLMAGIYADAGVTVADASRRFGSDDLRRRPGQLPLAVRRICRWTWACSPPPIGHDDHAKPTGYRVIAQAVLDALAGR
jgi:lysophospholipase L1-like esterase